MVSNSLLKSVKGISTRIVNLSLATIIGFSSLVAATPLLFPASASALATLEVGTGQQYATIQSAIDAATAGDIVSVAAGTYAENILVNKSITLQGAGQSAVTGTIINSSTAGVGISIGADNVTLKNLRVDRAGYGSGVKVESISVSGLTFDGVTVTGASNAVNHLTAMYTGFLVATSLSVSGLTVTNSHFDGNDIGWWLAKDNANNSTITNVNVTNTTFNDNLNKGIYAEKLDHAVFDGITVNNSGTGGSTNHRAGIDINLKWAAYSNIEIKNSSVTNSGTGDPNGAGILIKARSTGGYSSPAATLDTVTLSNLTVTGNGGGGAYAAGIRIGESNNSLTGIDAGPTNVVISHSSFSGNSVQAVRNATLATTVNATNNYWGSTAPSFGSIISGNVTYDPWFTNSEMTIRSDARTVPDSSGNAFVNATTPQLVVTSPTQPITITVASGTNNASIDFSALISGNTGTLPQTTVNTANGNISIPAATTVTATGGTWDGVINAPTIQPNSSVSVPASSGNITTIGTVIDVGSDSVSLTFDKAVRLFIPGQANKLVAFVRNGVLTQISNLCSADNQGAGDALPAGGECYVNVGSDMVVWTKHFTTFVTYTQTKAQTYTVVAGDTLSRIGARAGIAWRSIASTNNISAPYTIYPGQVLKLPAGSTVAAPASTPVVQSTTPAAAVLGESSNPQIGTAVSTAVVVPAVTKKANQFNWYWFYAATALVLAAVIYYVYKAADKKS